MLSYSYILNFLIRMKHAFCMSLLLLLLSLSACSAVDEDLLPCAPPPNTYTTVRFVYDYNMQYTDLFDKHAGSVSLYVFDEDGIMLFRETKSKVDMPGNEVDFSMVFDDKTIIPGKTYNFVAMANGNHAGYDDMVANTPGFQVEPSVEMIPGVSRIEDFIIKLDRDDDGTYDFGIVNYKDAYGDNNQMIDTVWSTKPDEVQTVTIPVTAYTPSPIQLPDVNVDVEIPMMRLTNSVKVNLYSGGFDQSTDPESYRMLIYFPNGNGTIDFTGTTYPAQALFYQTLRKKMVPYTPGNPSTRDGSYALQGHFGVSRLQMDDESSMQIRDPETNDLITEIPDFSAFLAHAFDYYGDEGQEFLDREYNFEVTITPKGLDPSDDPQDNWAYIEIYIEVLNWYVRINNIGF